MIKFLKSLSEGQKNALAHVVGFSANVLLIYVIYKAW